MPRPLHALRCASIALSATGLAIAQQPAFVYDVPDGTFEDGDHYSARLEQIQQSGDDTVMRFTFASASHHPSSIVLFRGVCQFLSLRHKPVAELLKHGDDRDTFVVRTLDTVSAAKSKDRQRVFVTSEICNMSRPVKQ